MPNNPTFKLDKEYLPQAGRFITTQPFEGSRADWYYSSIFKVVTVVRANHDCPEPVADSDPTAVRIIHMYQKVREEFSRRYQALPATLQQIADPAYTDNMIDEVVSELVSKYFNT